MKKETILILIIALGLIGCSSGNKAEKPKDPYFGQNPPGLTPEKFAADILPEDSSKFNSVFTPDFSEFYFTMKDATGERSVMCKKFSDNKWLPAKKAPFAQYFSDCDPFVTRDGKKIYFISKRPLDKNGKAKDFDIWYSVKTNDGWSEAANPGAPINTDTDEYYVSLTENGTIYFASGREGGFGSYDLYRSEMVDGKYLKAENLGEAINTSYFEHDPFIAHDESFLIFTSVDKPDGQGSGDLYISFRDKDGSWSKSKNMGKMFNTEKYDYCPVISPDDKYMFFTRSGDIYWVSIEVVKKIRKDE